MKVEAEEQESAEAGNERPQLEALLAAQDLQPQNGNSEHRD